MTAYDDKEYNEWLKHKGEVDPEDQRYTWPGQKPPLLSRVLVVVDWLIILLGMIVLAIIAIWRWGR